MSNKAWIAATIEVGYALAVAPESSNELIGKICKIVAKSCKTSAVHIKPAAELIELGVDSVSVVDIAMEIEDVFGIEISEHDPAFATVKTVNDLAAFVAHVVSAQAPNE